MEWDLGDLMVRAKPWTTKKLVLGWKVAKNLEPRYWSEVKGKVPEPGGHSLSDVVTTGAETVGHHTVIIAQSGSGKSFFLGRLIEEILIKTRSRVLVLDPNSDFRKVSQVKRKAQWGPKFRYPAPKAFLADEPSQAEFNARWTLISPLVHTKPNAGKGSRKEDKGAIELQLDWLKFPVELLAEEAADEYRDQVRHCHRLVNILAELALATQNKDWLNERFWKEVEDFFTATAQFVGEDENEKEIIDELEKQFGSVKQAPIPTAPQTGPAGPAFDKIIKIPRSFDSLAGILDSTEPIGTDAQGRTTVQIPPHLPILRGMLLLKEGEEEVALDRFRRVYQVAATSRRFVLDEARAFYFGRASELQSSGLVTTNLAGGQRPAIRQDIEVVDLPAAGELRQQKMAICTFIEAEWARARAELAAAFGKTARNDTRVPTFIVVEEAHNIIPADPVTPVEKKLREEFRRIAAEGRKYGLFLILVSQRPDKLDRMVMSECENRAVMKVGSSLILRTTCEILGLDGVIPRMTDKVLDFELGRALLAGPWVSDEPTLLVSAARRTEEGGRDLQPKYWARPRGP